MKIFQCSGCVGIDQEPDVQPENEALLKIFWRVLFQVSCKDDKVTIPEQKVFFSIQDVKIFAFPLASRHFPFLCTFQWSSSTSASRKASSSSPSQSWTSPQSTWTIIWITHILLMIVDRSPGYILSSSEGQFPPPLAFHTGRSPFLMLTIIQVQ